MHLRYDLFSVNWDIKPYPNQQDALNKTAIWTQQPEAVSAQGLKLNCS